MNDGGDEGGGIGPADGGDDGGGIGPADGGDDPGPRKTLNL
jgi:hypothetical protein